MKISEKRKAGEYLGRERIALNVIKIAKDISEGSYKNAIEKAGMISVFVDACGYDDYWSGKAIKGKLRQEETFHALNSGFELDPVAISEEPKLSPGTIDKPRGELLCKCDNGVSYTFTELAEVTGKRAASLYETYRRKGYGAVKLY